MSSPAQPDPGRGQGGFSGCQVQAVMRVVRAEPWGWRRHPNLASIGPGVCPGQLLLLPVPVCPSSLPLRLLPRCWHLCHLEGEGGHPAPPEGHRPRPTHLRLGGEVPCGLCHPGVAGWRVLRHQGSGHRKAAAGLCQGCGGRCSSLLGTAGSIVQMSPGPPRFPAESPFNLSRGHVLPAVLPDNRGAGLRCIKLLTSTRFN